MLLFMGDSCVRRDELEDKMDVAIDKNLKHNINKSKVQSVPLGNVTQISKRPKSILNSQSQRDYSAYRVLHKSTMS